MDMTMQTEEIKVYDYIIIGGGPAGSTAATNLARNGFKVLVLEKEKFPRFHIGESLLPFCYHIFKDLGVLEQIESQFVRKPGATFSDIHNSKYSHWCFDKVIDDPSYLSFHVRRDEFDKILLDNSSKNGATVLEETKVTNLDMESSNLVIVEVETKDKKTKKFLGEFIIDASGQSTLIGKKLIAKHPRPALRRVAYYTHWKNYGYDKPLANGTIRIVMLEGEKKGWIWLIPVGENQMSIGVVVDMSYANQQKRVYNDSNEHDWVNDFYLNELSSSDFVKQIIDGAEMLQDISITSDYSYNVDHKYGEKHALIGDASAFLDPIFSSGVFLALKSAMLVTNALMQKDKNAIEEAYKELEGGYRLVERLITSFYDKNTIKFPDNNPDSIKDYGEYESAFSVMHLILAGDFFKNHEKYFKSIEALSDKKTVDRFKNLTNHGSEAVLQYCEGKH
jgi:flavin-dependent dehydrogenase